MGAYTEASTKAFEFLASEGEGEAPASGADSAGPAEAPSPEKAEGGPQGRSEAVEEPAAALPEGDERRAREATPSASGDQKAEESQDDELAKLDAEIEALSKAWQEQLKQARSQEKPAAPGLIRESAERRPAEPERSRGVSPPRDEEELNLDDLTPTEAALYKQLQALRSRTAEQDALLRQILEERMELQRQQAAEAVRRKVESAKTRFPEVFGKDAPFAEEASEAVALALMSTDEPEELIVLKTAKRFRQKERDLLGKFLQNRLAQQRQRSGRSGGSAGGVSSHISGETAKFSAQDLRSGKLAEAALQALKGLDFSEL